MNLSVKKFFNDIDAKNQIEITAAKKTRLFFLVLTKKQQTLKFMELVTLKNFLEFVINAQRNSRSIVAGIVLFHTV